MDAAVAGKKPRFLQINEYNGTRNDCTPKIFIGEILRETPKFFVTRPSFVYNIIGFSPTEKNKKEVYWCKKTMHRRGDSFCQATATFKITKLMAEFHMPDKAIELH